MEELVKRKILAEAQMNCVNAEMKAYDFFRSWGADEKMARYWIESLSESDVPKQHKKWFARLTQDIEKARAAVELAKAETPEGGYLKDSQNYNRQETASHNLIKKIRWGTDDEHHDLAFWLNRWFGL